MCELSPLRAWKWESILMRFGHLGEMELFVAHVSPPQWNGRISLIARFMGPTWGPSGADKTQVGPMLAPWTLLSVIMLWKHNTTSWYASCYTASTWIAAPTCLTIRAQVLYSEKALENLTCIIELDGKCHDISHRNPHNIPTFAVA